MRKLVPFLILAFCIVSFAAPAWSKKDGDPPVVKPSGGDLPSISYSKF